MYFSIGGWAYGQDLSNMKGIGIEELGYAFLGIFIILIIGYVAISAYGGLPGGEIFTCEPNPPAWKFWCKIAEQPDYIAAKQSTDALVCAINSVALGIPQSCVTQKASFTVFAQKIEPTVSCKGEVCCESVIYSPSTIYVWKPECEKPVPDQYCPPEKYLEGYICCAIDYKSGPSVVYQWEDDCGIGQEQDKAICEHFYGYEENKKCCEIISPHHYWAPTCNNPVSNEKCYGRPSLACEVKNFNLPQEVTNAEKWIAGYGDPKFLVYWTSFPPGEDSAWTGYSSWLSDVGTVVLFAIPAGRLLKTGEKVAVGTFNKIKDKLMPEAGEKFLSFLKKIKPGAEEKAIIEISEEGVSLAERSALTKGFVEGEYGWMIESLPSLSDRAKKVIKDILKFNVEYTADEFKALMKVAGVTTATAFLATWIDNVNDKYEKIPNSVVLKQPYVPKDKISLTDNMKGGLVLLNRGELVSFYLASPCEADLTVTLTDFYCQSYSFNENTGAVYCKSAKEKEGRYTNLSTVDVCNENILKMREKYKEEYHPELYKIGICWNEREASKYIPSCGNEETAKVEEGKITGTSPEWCKTKAVVVDVKKIDTKGPNFCYSEPSKLETFIFVGTILADAALTYLFPPSLLLQVGVGATGGIAYVAAERMEKWP
jgi:hypothetical protein